jgi:hypothetical protein
MTVAAAAVLIKFFKTVFETTKAPVAIANDLKN